MSEQFFDLNFQLMPSGAVLLTQTDYSGNDSTIDAHPVQILHIARTLRGNGNRWPPNFADRLWRIRNQLSDLVNTLASVPCFPPSDDETDDVLEAREALQALDNFMADFDIEDQRGVKNGND